MGRVNMTHPTEQRSLDELLSHANWMQSLARSLVRDAASADDLVQETMLRALRRPPKVTESKSARPWLARVLRNAWRERGRQDQARVYREQHSAASEALPGSDEQEERLARQQEIAAAVQSLEEPYRSTILWRYYDGLSSAQIARKLGEPSDRIRWRLKRAKELLRQQLEQKHREDWVVRFSIFLPSPERPLPPPPGLVAGASLGAFTMSSKITLVALTLLALTLAVSLTQDAPQEEAVVAGLDLGQVEPPASPLADEAEPLRTDTHSVRTAAPLPQPNEADLGSASSMPSPTTGSLSGVVLSARTGAPVADARVVLRANLNNVAEWIETRSDLSGRFAFETLEAQDYTLDILANGHLPGSIVPVLIEAGVEREVLLDLRTGFPLAVQVSTESGEVIRAAQVHLIPGDSSAGSGYSREAILLRSAGAQTDPSGIATVQPLEPGPYLAVVRAEGFAALLAEITVHSDQDQLQFVLKRPGSIGGTIRRANGSPAEGARVFLSFFPRVRTLQAFHYEENGVAVAQDGSYRIVGLPAGSYYVAVIEPDGSGGFQRDGDKLLPVEVTAGNASRLNLNLPEPASLSGLVVDTQGQPVEGAQVSISWADYRVPAGDYFPLADAKDSIHHPCETDAEGKFEIRALRVSWKALKLTARKTGFVSQDVELLTEPGLALQTRVELTRLDGRLSGSLHDEGGQPVADQTVLAWEMTSGKRGALHQAISEADGTFEFQVPASASGFQLYPRLSGRDPYTAAPARREDVLVDSHGVDFVLHSKSVLEGKVVDAQGLAVPKFQVAFVDAVTGMGDDQERADLGSGHFRLYVPTSRPKSAVFTAPGYAPSTVSDLSPTSHLRVTLSMPPVLHGRVLDAHGQPLEGAIVGLATLDGSSYPIGHASPPKTCTDKAGEFHLAGVPAEVDGQLLLHTMIPGNPPLLHFSLRELRKNCDAAGVLQLALPPAFLHALFFLDDGKPEAPSGTVILIDAQGWPLDPRLEASFRETAELVSTSFGKLVEGQVSFHLAAGSYNAVLIQPGKEQRAFPFDVGNEAGESLISLSD